MTLEQSQGVIDAISARYDAEYAGRIRSTCDADALFSLSNEAAALAAELQAGANVSPDAATLYADAQRLNRHLAAELSAVRAAKAAGPAMYDYEQTVRDAHLLWLRFLRWSSVSEKRLVLGLGPLLAEAYRLRQKMHSLAQKLSLDSMAQRQADALRLAQQIDRYRATFGPRPLPALPALLTLDEDEAEALRKALAQKANRLFQCFDREARSAAGIDEDIQSLRDAADLTKLDALCDELSEIHEEMKRLMQAAPLSRLRQNLDVVGENLLRFEERWLRV